MVLIAAIITTSSSSQTLDGDTLVRTLLMPQTVENTKMSSTVQIVKTPDTLHGKPRLEGTRVGVLQVGELVRQRQWSISEVADQLGLDDAQVRAATEYYDEHPELMDTLRAQKEARKRSVTQQSQAE
ncbi:DUF433 domain-containing protein [Haloarcula sediminis]